MPTLASYRHALLLVAASACWGSGTVLSKQVLDRGVAPLTLLVIELTASCLLLLAVLLLGPDPRGRRPVPIKLAALGVLNPGLAYALGLLGLVTISASTSVLLWATEPVLILLLAVLVLREQIPAATVAALTVAVLGVLLVIYSPGATADPRGITLTVGAVAACATYTVLTRRLLLDDATVKVALVQQAAALTAALLIAGGAAVAGLSDLELPADPSTWALAAASGAVYYGLAFWFFISALHRVEASFAGTFLPLVPVFGLLAAQLAGDQLHDRQWAGAILVITATAALAIHDARRHRASASANS